MNFDPCVSPYTKINSKYIINTHARLKMPKLPEENLGEKIFCDLELGIDFFRNDTKVTIHRK